MGYTPPFETSRELNYRHAEKRGFFAGLDGSIEGESRPTLDPGAETCGPLFRGHMMRLPRRFPFPVSMFGHVAPKDDTYTTAVVGGGWMVMFEMFCFVLALPIPSHRLEHILSQSSPLFSRRSINLSRTYTHTHISIDAHGRVFYFYSMTASQSISIHDASRKDGQRIDRSLGTNP